MRLRCGAATGALDIEARYVELSRIEACRVELKAGNRGVKFEGREVEGRVLESC